MKIAVVYHHGCPDGIYSLKVARYALEAQGHEVSAVPGRYGKDPEIPAGTEKIYFVDFSLPRESLELLNSKVPVVVLDHHDTARAALEGLPYAVFDMSESGATLTWKHFFHDQPVPALLAYARDRDLWLWELPGSKDISAYIMELDKTEAAYPGPDEWGAEDYIQHIMNEGARIRAFRDGFARKTAAGCHYRKFGDLVVPCTFAPTMESEIGHELLEAHDDRYPMSVNFIVQADGTIRVSARGRVGAIHCGNFMREFHGGGGHPAAAGCTFANLSELDRMAPPTAKLPDNK